jgi:hypothetical protein
MGAIDSLQKTWDRLYNKTSAVQNELDNLNHEREEANNRLADFDAGAIIAEEGEID